MDDNLKMKALLDIKFEATEDKPVATSIKDKPDASCFKKTVNSSSVKVKTKTKDSLGNQKQLEVLDLVYIVEKLSEKYSPKFARCKSKNFINNSNSSKKKKKPLIVPK